MALAKYSRTWSLGVNNSQMPMSKIKIKSKALNQPLLDSQIWILPEYKGNQLILLWQERLLSKKYHGQGLLRFLRLGNWIKIKYKWFQMGRNHRIIVWIGEKWAKEDSEMVSKMGLKWINNRIWQTNLLQIQINNNNNKIWYLKQSTMEKGHYHIKLTKIMYNLMKFNREIWYLTPMAIYQINNNLWLSSSKNSRWLRIIIMEVKHFSNKIFYKPEIKWPASQEKEERAPETTEGYKPTQ